MSVEIINRGRGPEIKGTRITVYNILDYTKYGHDHTYIAAVLRLSTEQVLAALDYIDKHKDEVMAEYQKMEEWAANPYTPEVQAKVDAIKAKYDVLWADRRKKAMEANGDEWAHG